MAKFDIENELPTVYDYLDVCKYLKVYREVRRKIEPSFTNVYICYCLGQKNSRGYFNNVIAGRVRIGDTIVERFIKLLDLDKKEAAYFKVLVKFSQCGERDEKEKLLRKLIGKNPNNFTEINEDAISYYQHWRHAVIRALLDIVDFDGKDLEFLSKKLIVPIKKSEIKKSLDLLEANGLILKNKNGFYKPVDKYVVNSIEIQQALMPQYQMMQFNHSLKVMLNKDVRPQKVSSMTISVSQQTYVHIKEKIDNLKTEIRSLAESEQGPAERLYQMNLHIFPHSVEL